MGDSVVSVGDPVVSAGRWVGMTGVFFVVTGGTVVSSVGDTVVCTEVMAGAGCVSRTLSIYPRA